MANQIACPLCHFELFKIFQASIHVSQPSPPNVVFHGLQLSGQQDSHSFQNTGRYRCGSLLRYFSPSCSGVCELCGLKLEDLAHILVPRCPCLQERRELLISYGRDRLAESPVASSIFEHILASQDSDNLVQFLLDPSAVPEIFKLNVRYKQFRFRN